jgi:hypothetical protein
LTPGAIGATFRDAMRNAARLGAGLAGVLACWTALAGAKVADTYSVAPGTADSAAAMPCTSAGTGAFICPNLRSALAAAAPDDGSTVQLSAGMYTLSHGQLTVDAPFNTLTITGAGSGATTIAQSVGAGERVIKLASQDATVSISGVTITGGDQTTVDGTCTPTSKEVDGGGILNAGTLSLGDVTVSANKATGGNGANASSGNAGAGNPANGGGICSSGPLTVFDSTITGNIVAGGNGGKGSSTASGGSGGGASGGGIESTGILSVARTTASSNQALGGAGGRATGTGTGGGGGFASGDGIDVTQGMLTPNPTTSITDTQITDNAGLGGTGGNATGSGHFPGGGGSGFGGLSTNSFGATTIASSTISDNTATGAVGGTPANGASASTGGSAAGAGLDVTGPLTLTDSTLSGNRASGGPAAAGSFGGGGFGGAIDLSDPTTIVNSTIAGNQVSAGAGAGEHALGGGVYDQQLGTETLTLASVTIAGNTATAATSAMALGGNLSRSANSPITARDTIITAGTASAGSANCDGKIASDAGHNLESTAPSQCGLNPDAGDVIGSDPLLGALASNGGPTRTMAPGTGSPAIGAGAACTDPSSGGQPLKTDQRGDPRTNPCDIGAFQGQPPTVTVAPAITGRAVVGETVTCSPGNYAGDAPLASGLQWQRSGTAIPGATGPRYRVALADAGQQLSCRVTETNPYGMVLATSAAVSVASPPPTISGLRQSHRRWRDGSRLAAISRKRPPVGTTFTFTLDQPARLKLSFARLVPGRGSGHKCAAQTRHNRHQHSCTRAAPAGTLTLANGHSGTDTIGFQGRLSKRKRLHPGRYRLTLTATGAGGTSAGRTITFTIARR